MAEEDNLEYYITFPSPNFDYKNQNGDDFVFVIDEEKVPVVILFGWAGAEDKYLSVYSKIYEEKGWVIKKMSDWKNCDEISTKLYENLGEAENMTERVLFFCEKWIEKLFSILNNSLVLSFMDFHIENILYFK